MSSEPYDPYIPAGQGAAGGAPKDTRTKHIQEQIDGTIGVMRDNINKFAERGAGLNSLQNKTGELAESANDFRRGANQVRKKMWWKDMKMRIWLGIGIVVLLAIIIIPSVLATRK